MSVLLEHPANVVAYRPTKPTAMVVIADPRVRNTVTRHLWALGVRDVIEVSSIAEARPRISNPRDICIADVHLPDGSGLTVLAETRAAGWPNGLALSAADDIGAVRSALAGGVKGYVVTGTRTNMPMPGRPGLPIGAGLAGRMRRPGIPGHHHPGMHGAPASPAPRPVPRERPAPSRPPTASSPAARWRCCDWSPRASRTRRSAWPWACRR
ncbi:LuxR family transcriptional regulator [Kitasatospora cheerisanensis KCTC 2395]|uniref:LuxR family transcriptional regulator n=1 Tax=Kitasatospora cheerisanensis KCTC 2395 TaxID=1348663 RepID=A0A066YX14_9ACTN|nr:LuxR family transcriptional regulator [Kitasatospora cheerisanensis KCTC 2395]